ncbi:GtrA family protein [Streptomyces sp. TRM68367]|uniref:GtrA family protein n=1 Tax=Streptomyces sp. TRM68367 TaxID=2758415 RepID=UPI00165A390B|nr:GtrA family protein [Streptomyces sp. TRM68367]MBC9725482.1 GtrA family protein [Streptomyces sp. TRM68367]
MTVNVSEERVIAPPRPVKRVVLEVVNFGVVGGSGVAVNFLVFNLLLHGLAWPAMVATVLASLLAMGSNYLGFRYFTYRDRAARTHRQIVLFFVFSGIGVAMESGLFYVGYHGLGLHGPLQSNLVKALSIVLASAFRFLVYRTWVFQHDARRG